MYLRSLLNSEIFLTEGKNKLTIAEKVKKLFLKSHVYINRKAISLFDMVINRYRYHNDTYSRVIFLNILSSRSFPRSLI
jgi:hypothetical protein